MKQMQTINNNLCTPYNNHKLKCHFEIQIYPYSTLKLQHNAVHSVCWRPHLVSLRGFLCTSGEVKIESVQPHPTSCADTRVCDPAQHCHCRRVPTEKLRLIIYEMRGIQELKMRYRVVKFEAIKKTFIQYRQGPDRCKSNWYLKNQLL